MICDRAAGPRLVRGSLLLLLAVVAATSCRAAGVPAAGSSATAAASPLQPVGRTDALPHDPDDPAIWRHPSDPGLSLILATDKMEATGGLFVFGLDGRRRQAIAPLDRPNNVDVEYGVRLGGRLADIAVLTERRQRRLRVFRVRPDGSGLDDLAGAGIPVLEGAAGPAGEPMGIGLYKRASDGAVFAIVAPKSGGAVDYLWQYRLEDDGRGGLRGVLVRRFGAFSGAGPAPGEAGEIEAVAVDDELGFVYYADERFGVRKWHADPDHPAAGRELAVFGTDGYQGDREGLAVYAEPGGRGYLVSSDQVPGGTRLHIYPRAGSPGSPHSHPRLAVIPTTADDTDGLETTPPGVPGHPRGLLVMMNSRDRNFLVYDWRAVEAALAGASGLRR